MLILSASTILGCIVSIVIFLIGQHITIFIKDIVLSDQAGTISIIVIIAIMVCFLLFAIGTVGAVVAIGMHYITGITFTQKKLPGFLRIIRIAGLVLVIIPLLMYSIVFVYSTDYASSSTRIHITSDSKESTLYIPVLSDNNGNVLKMYETPTITGNTTVALIDTRHGKALKISGVDREIEIRTQQKHGIKRGFGRGERFLKEFSISMSNFTFYENITSSQMIDVWVYSEDNIKNCFIDFNIDTGCGQIMSIRTRNDQEIRKGWKKVKFTRFIYLNYD